MEKKNLTTLLGGLCVVLIAFWGGQTRHISSWWQGEPRTSTGSASAASVQIFSLERSSELLAQPTSTPGPTPTATPPGAEYVPPDLRGEYDYLYRLQSAVGWWALLILAIIAALVLVLTGIGKRLIDSISEWAFKIFGMRLVKWQTTLSRSRATRKYLDSLTDVCGQVDVAGLAIATQVPVRLHDIFVPLRGTVVSALGETLMTDFDVESYLERGDLRAASAVSLDDLVATYPRLILVGGVGSGKTTFLKHVALALVESGAGKWPGRSRQHKHTIPILISLPSLSIFLGRLKNYKASDAGKVLNAYLRERYEVLKLPETFFEERLEKGHCVLLLEALDDIFEFEHQFRMVQYVSRLSGQYKDCQFIVTSREARHSANLGLVGFVKVEIRELRSQDITELVHRWNLVLSAAMDVLPADATNRSVEDLAREKTTVLVRRIEDVEGLMRLAGIPLFLTIMALVHAVTRKVPSHRASLYDQCVQVLLLWESMRNLGNKRSTSPPLARRWSPETSRLLLEDLAFWMQEEGWERITMSSAQAHLTNRIVKQLEPQDSMATKLARGFLDWALDHSYLLCEDNGFIRFVHLQFQHFLAARYLVRQETFSSLVAPHIKEPWWRETLELALGLLGPFSPERLAEAVGFLLGYDETEMGLENQYVGLRIVARGLENVNPELLTVGLRNEIAGRITEATSDVHAKLDSTVRVHLTGFLGLIGKPQDLQAVIRVPRGFVKIGLRAEDVVPWMDMVWEFLGCAPDKQDTLELPEIGAAFQEWLSAEVGSAEVFVPHFYISRFPVTNSLFAEFVKEGGYDIREFWTEEGWAWCQAERQKVSRAVSLSFGPCYWHDPRFSQPNSPVVGITWYEATAFCRWLTVRWQDSGRIEDNQRIHLPTEAQWEKAAGFDPATGTKRAWPWGNSWIAGRANTSEEHLGGPSPVGAFLGDDSAYGVRDMAGNVWEWCNTKWGGDRWHTKYSYPYRPDDGRELQGGSDPRVVRGGSWDHSRVFARCTARRGRRADHYDNATGFRICVSHEDGCQFE